MTLEEAVQKSSAGSIVTLFRIDLSIFDGGIVNLTPGPLGNDFVVFQGIDYIPVPIEATGFSWNGKGTLPRPIIRISAVATLLAASILEFNDLLGATVMRIRTFEKFLDNGSEPDPNAHFPLDIYRVERKVNQNKEFIEWELSTFLDQEGVQLPKRQVLRDICTHRYRFWNSDTNQYEYQGVTCPYTGTAAFDLNDAPVEPKKDVCSKRLSGCRARFGENGILPSRAFPGVARIR